MASAAHALGATGVDATSSDLPIGKPKWTHGRAVFRFVLVYLISASSMILFEERVLSAMVPVVEVGLKLFQPTAKIRQVSCVQGRIIVDARVTRMHEGQNKWFDGEFDANGRMLLIAPLLILCLVLSWKHETHRHLIVALLIGCLFSVILVAHDTSFVWASATMSELGGPMTIGDYATTFYSFFLLNGGRAFLAIFAAFAAVRASSRMVRLPAPPKALPKKRGRRKDY